MYSNMNYIELNKIKPNKNNIRKTIEFDSEQWNSFKSNIKENGILSPLIVRKDNDGIFILVAGHRRYFAAQQIGLKKVPYIVLEKNISDTEVMLIEQCSRQDIQVEEQARAIYELFKKYKTYSAVARAIGCSSSFVSSRVSMIENLTKEQLEQISNGVIAPNMAVEAQRILKDNKRHFDKIMDSAQNGNIKNSMKVRSLVNLLKDIKDMPNNIVDSLINGELTEDESKFLLLVENNKQLQNEMYEELRSKSDKMSSKDLITYVQHKLEPYQESNMDYRYNTLNKNDKLKYHTHDEEIKMNNIVIDICKYISKLERDIDEVQVESIQNEHLNEINQQINRLIESLNRFCFRIKQLEHDDNSLKRNNVIRLVK